MKIRTSYTGCSYITAGKIYDAKPLGDGMASIETDNVGMLIVIYRGRKCGHLNSIGTWEIVADAPTYANNLTKAADHIAEALTLLRAASADSETSLQRAAARHMIEPASKLHASVYELACAAQDTRP